MHLKGWDDVTARVFFHYFDGDQHDGHDDFDLYKCDDDNADDNHPNDNSTDYNIVNYCSNYDDEHDNSTYHSNIYITPAFR